ncbi:hypothetical protein IRJ34_17035 [Paenarthrobacter sp. GOM3]|uniref:hypothetical protein n=1 Tax=Paenarthrobacter sp. GOM3 TaxID=2782567 RepID=UPI001BA45535|nr:hypothetical protein [Paenarthrobacter sp. GOM3]WOH18037.1 hypothetical protein IRJ34_17035 [Paenarthrobacter sp. GOM3]
MTRRGKLLAATLAALVFLGGLLSGCGQSPSTDSLKGPAKEAASAVRTASLAVDLRLQERATAAAGTTTADDMLKGMQSATDELESFGAKTQEEQSLRDSMLTCFSTISRSLLHARDALAAPNSAPDGGKNLAGSVQLPAVQGELRTATEQLDALMTKAGIQ